MFKPGEIAGVKGPEIRVVMVIAEAPPESTHKWPVMTSDGVFNETDLFVTDPSVLSTANGVSWADYDNEDVAGDLAPKRLSYELSSKIENMLKKATLDLNGHWKSGQAIDEECEVLAHVFLNRACMTEEEAEALLDAYEVGAALDRWVPVDIGIRSHLRQCPFCNDDDLVTETNGLVVRLAGDLCEFPDGLPLTEWELNVSSGKLVVANDLRGPFPLPNGEDFDVNTPMGCRQTALTYATNGLSHAFVGNSCPGVYRCSDGSYKIANPPSTDRWNGKRYVKKKAPKFDGERVASISTDLWWYSVCDYAEFQLRCAHFKIDESTFDIEVLDVQPGVYRFEHNEEARGHSTHKECVYTRFQRVRDPDPVKDFLREYDQVHVNPNAYVQAQVAKWPTLYGKVKYGPSGRETASAWSAMSEEEQKDSWRRVADHLFCVVGGGTEWHERGFPRAKVDLTVPDVAPPQFRAQYSWYPFSDRYGGLSKQKVLSSSFAKLAFRVLESIISFGMCVQTSARAREVTSTRERMLVAVQRYRKLVEQYPEQADPEYVAWLSQKGRAEAWVENFDLGPEITASHRAYVQKQRWVPDDTYAVAFDARELQEGHFACSPARGGGWARKEGAERYAILRHEDNGRSGDRNCFWASHATNTAVPLCFVARVVKLGEVSHMGETLVEIEFDYGTPWMRNKTARKALAEAKERPGIRLLTREAYELLLSEAIDFFKAADSITVPELK